MLKKLRMIKQKRKVYYIKDGIVMYGIHSGIEGDVSGIEGDVSGIGGDINECLITEEERKKGINIGDLIL